MLSRMHRAQKCASILQAELPSWRLQQPQLQLQRATFEAAALAEEREQLGRLQRNRRQKYQSAQLGL